MASGGCEGAWGRGHGLACDLHELRLGRGSFPKMQFEAPYLDFKFFSGRKVAGIGVAGLESGDTWVETDSRLTPPFFTIVPIC